MGGRKSPDFAEYVNQCKQALLVARKHAKQVRSLMEIMTHHSSFPAFRYVPNIAFGSLQFKSVLLVLLYINCL
jgi:hypothetical protein